MYKFKAFWRDFGEGPRLFDILQKNVGKNLIIFDTETTGLSPDNDRIIQISAIKTEIAENMEIFEVDRLNLYINPERKLSPKIVQLTGITDEILANSPVESVQWEKIYNFFGDEAIVCCHNTRFDVSMIQPMYIRNCGHELTLQTLDTMVMARELHHKDEAGNHKLGTLAGHFALDYGLTFHNSMDDVIATMRLLQFFIEEYKEKKEEYDNDPFYSKMRTKVKSCWHYEFTSRVPGGTKADGTPKYKKNFRLYVRLQHQNRCLFISQTRPYEWGEKDKGTLALFDIADIEQQVLKLYNCSTLEELSKVRESKYS